MSDIHEQVNMNNEEEKQPEPVKTKKVRRTRKPKVVKKNSVVRMLYEKNLNEKKLYIKKQILKLQGTKVRKEKNLLKQYQTQLELYNTKYTDDISQVV